MMDLSRLEDEVCVVLFERYVSESEWI